MEVRSSFESAPILITVVFVAMRYTSCGQDTRTTIDLLFKLVDNLSEICCKKNFGTHKHTNFTEKLLILRYLSPR